MDTRHGEENENVILAYCYKRKVRNYQSEETDYNSIVEYHIPDYSIAFNLNEVFFAKRPNNILSCTIDDVPIYPLNLAYPLTKVLLPTDLVIQIKNCMDSFNKIDQRAELHKIANFSDLFIKSKFSIGTVFFRKNNDNAALSKILINYIFNNTLPQGLDLDIIFSWIKRLNADERKSIADCIQQNLQFENYVLEKPRTQAIEKIDENNSIVLKGAATVGSIGVLGSIATGVNALIPSIGLPLFFFARSKYQKKNENNSWDEREMRASEIMRQINDYPNIIIRCDS